MAWQTGIITTFSAFDSQGSDGEQSDASQGDYVGGKSSEANRHTNIMSSPMLIYVKREHFNHTAELNTTQLLEAT